MRLQIAHAQPPLVNPPPLAPDGLPWPPGYFDREPRVSLEESIKVHGIRPSRYWKGFPVYTAEDCQKPNYKSPYPSESETK
jgi:hypothetical protein